MTGNAMLSIFVRRAKRLQAPDFEALIKIGAFEFAREKLYQGGPLLRRLQRKRGPGQSTIAPVCFFADWC